IKQRAQHLMELIDSYAAAGANSPGARSQNVAQSVDTEGRAAPHLTRRGESGQENRASQSNPGTGAAPDENRGDAGTGASMKIEGTKIMAGILAAIECNGGGLQLALVSNGQVVRFSVSDPVALQFYSQDPDFHANIGCGPINHAAFIHFKPVAGGQSGISGDAVAVEFRK